MDFDYYRNGGQGFIRWAEENVCMPIYPPGSTIPKWFPMRKLPNTPDPITGRSYQYMWDRQKEEFILPALEMKDGRFKHRLVVVCWPRGEGKTALGPALIQLWKFYNWPMQAIMLAANSKDQTKFITFQKMVDIILNSPNLLEITGRKNIHEKEIRMTDKNGDVVSIIRTVASATGILSNITGYSFSEIFQMKNPEFFHQIDGSIRNVPNALGVIDSTVSGRDHILYELYKNYAEQKDDTLFFSYRYSKSGDYKDYWHPEMSAVQLKSYKSKFILGAFERYFLNTWDSGADKMLTTEEVEAIRYIGTVGNPGNQEEVVRLIKKRNDIYAFNQKKGDNLTRILEMARPELSAVETTLHPVEQAYKLLSPEGVPQCCPLESLAKLSDFYDTDWAILAGLDRSDPEKRERLRARTIVVAVAKGLIGSRSSTGNPGEKNYIYLLLHLANVIDHSLEGIKGELMVVASEFGGVDKVTSERYGAWDLRGWAEQDGIAVELVYPHYKLQQEAFSELYLLINKGRFKSPPVPVMGSKSGDILIEELEAFEHRWVSDLKGTFGSHEKKELYGAQDDAVFAIAWAIYGGRNITQDDFRPMISKSSGFFGESYIDKGLMGRYN